MPTNVVNIRELEQIENFEGMNAWAIGLDRQRDFTVSTLSDPVRIVIDIANAPRRRRLRADDGRSGRLAAADRGRSAPCDALTGRRRGQSAVTKSRRRVRIPKTPRKWCTIGPIERANTAVPRPTVPPSAQPVASTVISMPVRTSRSE